MRKSKTINVPLKLCLTLAVSFMLLSSSCSADDSDDALPPITQIGANTAGCLVDGKVLIPKGGRRIFQCFYQFVDGEYYFSISFNDKTVEGGNIGCQVVSRQREIAEGETYNLSMDFEELMGYGGNYSEIINSVNLYSTNSLHRGSLTITKLDFDEDIVSGTFWFDAINAAGEIKEIRDGRFDAQFTQ